MDLVNTLAHECSHKYEGMGTALVDSWLNSWLNDTGAHGAINDFEDAVELQYRKDPNGDKCKCNQ